MGVIRPASLALAWVDAFNRHDADALASMYAHDGASHRVIESPVTGRAAIRANFANDFAASGVRLVISNVFEDGDWAILEWRDSSGLFGSGFFHVKRGEIVLQRGYRAGP
jgi:hypothetical protein